MKGESSNTKRNGNWVVLWTQKVFENPFFAVFEDDVIKPTGDEGKYATVRFKTGVAVLPVDDEGNVYLTRQFRYAIGRYDLEVVAGSIDGEAAIDAAKRELKEELGIEAAGWTDLGSIFSMTSITQSTSRQFIATDLTFGEQETEGTEDIEPVKLSLSDACDMVHRGEITDGDTCILLLKASYINEKKAADPSGTAANLRTGGVS